ncbi:hypothetical protein CHS0354_029922 [Potamilus streckersoni]|uniref:Uncharacterized protein n=1 Tax=Potamilus streckersoni TaxID=2493646 RepID=A0AAE0VJF1_9BIVA|nr:hypothetical protein CHS0354_029922 [Potamilus streckersoni]
MVETRANKRYVDPGFFLPPRVKDIPSGGFTVLPLRIVKNVFIRISNLGREIEALFSVHLLLALQCLYPNSLEKALLPATAPTLKHSYLILFLSLLKEEQLPVYLQLFLLYLMYLSLHHHPLEETFPSSNQSISAPERCIVTAKVPCSKELVLPLVPSTKDELQKYIDWIRKGQEKLMDALQMAITHLANIEGENSHK